MANRFCVALMIGVLLMAEAPGAQLPNPFSRGGDRNRPPPPTASIAFNREAYDSLQNFAEGLYKQKERPDFKLAVDRAFEVVLREHGQRAYAVNLSPASEIKRILEDRYREFSGLYDNLMVQDLVNRMGQEVAPKWSDKLVTFKLIADPVPRAEALATGTIYISTGLAASLDNKAQLAYVLAHEAAHVAKGHWKLRTMIELAKEEYAKANAQNADRMRVWGNVVGLGVGALIGKIAGGSPGATVAGAVVGWAIASAFSNEKRLIIDWNQFEEDEADDEALKAMLDAEIDVREVRPLYLALDKLAVKDDRVGMGFWGNRDRMRERLEAVNAFVKEKVPADAKLQGADPSFRRLIAELKRDNGILSFHYDMLEASRANLEQAVQVRDTDPVALYYYGKILKATARTEEEQKKAVEVFRRAFSRDGANQAYGAYLHSAVTLLDDATPDEKRRAGEWLTEYVDRYRQSMLDEAAVSGRHLPPHMDTIIDYMRRAGFETATVTNIADKTILGSKPAAPVTPSPERGKSGAGTKQRPAASPQEH